MIGRRAPAAGPNIDALGAPRLGICAALVTDDFDAAERLVADRTRALEIAQRIAGAGSPDPVLAAWLSEARAAGEDAEAGLRGRLDEIREELAALAAGRAALRAYAGGDGALSPGFVDRRD